VFLFPFSDVVCWPSVGPQDTNEIQSIKEDTNVVAVVAVVK